MPLREVLKREKEVLGFYVSAHPLDEFRDVLPLLISHQVADLPQLKGDTYVRLAGMVSQLNHRTSRKGAAYAQLLLDDLSGRTKVLVFPAAWRHNADVLKPDAAIVVEGYYNQREDEQKLILQRAYELKPTINALHIGLKQDQDVLTKQQLLKGLRGCPGPYRVILELPSGKVALNNEFKVAASLDFKQSLSGITGVCHVWYA